MKKMRKNSHSLEGLQDLTEPHRSHITTTKEWDEYAKQNGLPSSRILGNAFGTWNTFKEHMGIPINKHQNYISRKYTKEQLLSLANEYSQHFTSKAKWNAFAKEHKLPLYEVFHYHKIKWKDIQRLANIPFSEYSDEELLKLSEQYKEHFDTRDSWDVFAEQHGFPKSQTFHRRFGGWIEFKKMITGYDKEGLLKIAREHSLHFTTKANWDRYAKTNNLPDSQVFYRMFGKWNTIKALIK
ncbi:hypothetical protein [Bacillus sp. SM2101]|uniref:hypothetical protein n=1 Tax=Bacillus sp. SM2101 TaxID=2805366 RepID=UPI001BDE7A7C|nr:hypothetical protein [Bacillus sp. SM2101]